MEIVPIPVLSDNYAYLLVDKSNGVAAAIDPVEPEKVLEAATAHNVTITHILTTHSHWDHAGGNTKLVNMLNDSSIPVIGGLNDNVEGCTREVSGKDIIEIGDLKVEVFYVPCHTPGHVLYHCNDALFTGDTLFVAGCGNLNSGTPAQLYNALNEQIASLAPATRVFVGHEYTVTNLKFANTVEPNNEHVMKKLAWAIKQREQNKPTIPSTIQEELNTNPFMRVHEATVQAFAGESTDLVKVLRIIRERKNNFRA